MYRYYYTFSDDGLPVYDNGGYCIDAECAILCGKELQSGGFWVAQYAEPDNVEDAPLSQCTFIGKIYIEED